MRPVPATEGVVVGLALLALGVLWTLANFGAFDLLRALATWWPALLVAWGALEIYNWNVSRRRAS